MFAQLSAIAVIALMVITASYSTPPPHVEQWMPPLFEIIKNLSYGFLASYIFYLINSQERQSAVC